MVSAVVSDESGGVVGSPSFLHNKASIDVLLMMMSIEVLNLQ